MEYGAVPHTSGVNKDVKGLAHGSAEARCTVDVHEPPSVVRGRGSAAVAYGLALGAAAVFATAATVSVRTGGSGLSLPQSHHSFDSLDMSSSSMAATDVTSSAASLPHIAFVLVDDWGWNDVGYQSTDLGDCTPHMDSLAESGVKLSNYYTQPLCSPARAALLTGKYPVHIGMHHNVIESTSPWGLRLDEVSLGVPPSWLTTSPLHEPTTSPIANHCTADPLP
jgi:hypothetical protein